jgi:hypothetical protein
MPSDDPKNSFHFPLPFRDVDMTNAILAVVPRRNHKAMTVSPQENDHPSIVQRQWMETINSIFAD